MRKLFLLFTTIVLLVFNNTLGHCQKNTNVLKVKYKEDIIKFDNISIADVMHSDNTIKGKTIIGVINYKNAPKEIKYRLTLYFYKDGDTFELYEVYFEFPEFESDDPVNRYEYYYSGAEKQYPFSYDIEFVNGKFSGTFSGILVGTIDGISLSDGYVNFVMP